MSLPDILFHYIVRIKEMLLTAIVAFLVRLVDQACSHHYGSSESIMTLRLFYFMQNSFELTKDCEGEFTS